MNATTVLIDMVGESQTINIIERLQNLGGLDALRYMRSFTTIDIKTANELFKSLRDEWGIEHPGL